MFKACEDEFEFLNSIRNVTANLNDNKTQFAMKEKLDFFQKNKLTVSIK